MKAPEIIRLESHHWWEDKEKIDETKEGNIICFSFGNKRLRKIAYVVDGIEKDPENNRVFEIRLKRYRPLLKSP